MKIRLRVKDSKRKGAEMWRLESHFLAFSPSFAELKKTKTGYSLIEYNIDGWTAGLVDQQNGERTDAPSYRDA